MFFAIILLSLSLVSASWFSDLFSERTTGQTIKVTGDVQKAGVARSELPTSISKSEDNTNTFSRSSSATGTSSARKSQAPECPKGWTTLLAKDGRNCCKKAENTGRSLFSKR